MPNFTYSIRQGKEPQDIGHASGATLSAISGTTETCARVIVETGQSKDTVLAGLNRLAQNILERDWPPT